MTQNKKPEPKLNVTILDEKRTLVMSFGLLNTLMSYLDSPTSVINLGSNSDLALVICSECLAERNEEGVIVKQFNPFNLDTDTAGDVLSWVSEHVLDFFERTLASAERLGKIQAIQKSPPPSTNG